MQTKYTIATVIIIFGIIFLIFSTQKPLPHNTANPTSYSSPIPDSCYKKLYTMEEALPDLTSVCSLLISSNKDLKKLGTHSHDLTGLKILLMRNLPDKEIFIPSQIGNLQSLMELDINSAEGYMTLPSDIGKLTNLTTLLVKETELEKIPPEIADLKALQHLYIIRNEELSILPVSVAKLTQLTEVNLTGNPRLRVPDSLVSHKNLESITIREEFITKIPSQVYNLPKLVAIDYSDNAISTISAKLSSMTSLQKIFFRNNRLVDFPRVDALIRLQELSLEKNQLTKLPKGVERLTQLKALRLANNAIDDQTTDVLQNLINLESLDLCDNKLTRLPQGIEKLTKLQYLCLMGNTIDKSALEKLKQQFPHTNVIF